MTASFRAICSDFYINQKLSLKLELPRERHTALEMFDRVRKQFPAMTQVKRYKEEIALESDAEAQPQRWVAVRGNAVRSGVVNAAELEEGYELHRHVLELVPFYMGVSPLDIDFLEVLYGFDLRSDRNHDEIVGEALIANSPMAQLVDLAGAQIVDVQPSVGVVLREGMGDDYAGSGNKGVEVCYEVKTRPEARQLAREEPISVYLTLRHYGPLTDIRVLPDVLARLARLGEELIHTRVLPALVQPIRDSMGLGR
jgi:hypothetical protein